MSGGLRRRRQGSGPPREPRPDMTPMIDVVFLLVIFFTLVSEFERMEIESVTLPYAVEAVEEPPRAPNRLVVNVAADGQVAVMRRSLDREELGRFVAARAAAAGADKDGFSALHVKVRADAACQYGHVLGVMESCVDASVWHLSFAVQPTEDEADLVY
jgi:biopolymer transport protein ExbD